MPTHLCRTSLRQPAFVRGGFTLLELLAVITIVVLLAALAVPTLQRMLKQSSQADCMANLRQWAAAIHTYTSDQNGALPLAWNTVTGGRLSWNHYDSPVPTLLRETTGTEGLQRWRRGDSINGCAAQSLEPYSSGGYTYRYYSYLLNWHLGDPALPVYKKQLSAVPRPSQTILLTEGAFKKAQTGFYDKNYETAIGFPHQGKVNALFVDGHIESLKEISSQQVVP